MPARSLAVVFLVALAARLLVLPFALPRYGWGRAYPDTWQYEAMADNLLAGQGLVVGPGLEAVRPPLYPLFLLPFRALGGDSRGAALAAILAQCLLGAAAAALAARLAGFVFGRRAAWTAGLLIAVHPELVLYPALLLSESLAVPLTVAALAAAAAGRGKGAGVLAGAAALTRASLLPLGVLLAAWLAWTRGGRTALAALAACALVILPWTLRNRLRLGAWIPVTSKMGHDLYEQFNPQADGGPVEDRMTWPPAEGRGEAAQDRFLRGRAWDWIRAHPGDAIRLCGTRLTRLWNPAPNDAAHRASPLALPMAAFNLLLFAAALLGMARMPFATPAPWLLVAVPVLLVTAVHAVFMGSIRYRAPALPSVCVLAAAALGPRRLA